MIYLYSGTPGSGKSLHTAQVLYYQIAKGWPCICNFDFAYYRVKARHPGQFLYCANDSLTPGLLMGFSEDFFRDHPFHEGRILLVIDECQLLFNAREWDAKGRKEWLSFFTQHRKFGYDIILVAQFDRMIDRQIRSLIEYEQVHRKVSNFGFWGKLFSAVSGGKLFVSVKIWYPMKEKVGSEFFKANKKYYRLYDTYSKFNEEKVAESPKNSTKAEFCCVHEESGKVLETEKTGG